MRIDRNRILLATCDRFKYLYGTRHTVQIKSFPILPHDLYM